MRVKWSLDISSSEHRKLMSDRAQNIYYALGAGVLVVVLVFNILSFVKINKELKTYKDNTSTVAAAGAVSLSSLSGQFSHANSILERRSFSWSRFLSRLESAVPEKISISSVTPAFAGSNVSIEGVAMSIDDLTRFITKLNNSQNFNGVYLAEQKNTADGHVGFSISFKYIDTEAK